MANTYFQMQPEYKSGYDNVATNVSLTAFMGGNKSIQMTFGVYPYRSIMLSDEEAKRLASALMERVNGDISATGCEQSVFTDEELTEEESN